MKILTKNWAEKHEQVRFVHTLKEFEEQKMKQSDIIRESRSDFLNEIAKDEELLELCNETDIADKLYQAKIDRNRKTLLSFPKGVCDKIKNVNSLVLGYANAKDKKLLSSYASEILKEIEKKAEEANRLTEIAQDCLPNTFILDEIVGELVFEEYSNGQGYCIKIGDFIVCIENYQIIEREDFRINKWDNDNPLTLWTYLCAAELHYIRDKFYELHLLLVDGDTYANEKYWYFTLSGSNVKLINIY